MIPAEFINILESIMRNPGYNHAGTPSQYAIDFLKRGKIESLLDFEKFLRENNSKVYFVAVPLDYFGTRLDIKTQYIPKRDEEPLFTLYVCVNGKDEALALLKEINVTVEENEDRLLYTGVQIKI